MSPKEAYAAGMREALRFRASEHIGRVQAVCTIDIAMCAGVDVWVDDLPSIEGVYANQTPPRIVLSSLRPPGRRAFTCGHELGHHVFGHGTRIEEHVAEEPTLSRHTAIEEWQATGFAGFLLMPPTAVRNAFYLRGLDPADCTPEQIYAIASWFGVSYTGCVDHLSLALRAMPLSRARELKRVAPKEIRAALLPDSFSAAHLVIVDTHWRDRAIDVEVGDGVILPAQCQLAGGRCEVIVADGGRTAVRAVRPGLGHVTHVPTGWSAFVRVARAGFTGRACYRHLEEEDE